MQILMRCISATMNMNTTISSYMEQIFFKEVINSSLCNPRGYCLNVPLPR